MTEYIELTVHVPSQTHRIKINKSYLDLAESLSEGSSEIIQDVEIRRTLEGLLFRSVNYTEVVDEE